MMIRSEHLGHIVRIVDINGKVWHGKVAMITPAADSDSGENELAIEFSGGLMNFRECEILEIRRIKKESEGIPRE